MANHGSLFNTAMGPVENLTTGIHVSDVDIELQFGHGGDAVENQTNTYNRNGVYTLQFGHGGDAVENTRLARTAAPYSLASIRPRR